MLEKHEIIKRLQAQNINPTKQRIDIASLLFERPQHLCAEQIIMSLRQAGDVKASKATVYNTLKLFSQKGLLRELIVDAGKVFYDSNTSKHHHVYNVDTGEIWDLAPSDSATVIELPELSEDLVHLGVEVIYRVAGK